ncbi:cysteine protease family c1-related [Holotrichia oblita]|uniref:Cysteine protease family c1-related n=1 Tax=Holotrichia oblita TaxID=644536 RepID=A0ACB9SVN0_HOLOL|nr:cysteine protease family c1-related [Holotrichia oblita]
MIQVYILESRPFISRKIFWLILLVTLATSSRAQLHRLTQIELQQSIDGQSKSKRQIGLELVTPVSRGRLVVQKSPPDLDGRSQSEQDEVLEEEWANFKILYNKTYPTQEIEYLRKQNFFTNRKSITKFNQDYTFGISTFVMKINSYADMLGGEFNNVINGFRGGNRKEETIDFRPSAFIHPINTRIPQSIDWRELGGVTPVKNQGSCASCHAFSAAGAVEGHNFRKYGILVDLSPQNLVDCPQEKKYQSFGCNGGYVDENFKYIKENPGIDVESVYVYEAANGPCRFRPESIGANVTGYVEIPEGDERALEAAVATLGPVSAGIDASQLTFQFYSQGVYYDEDCKNEAKSVNHAVLVVGFGQEPDGQKYWLVKNSYGSDWGNGGYIKMAKDRNNHCAIATSATYPLSKQLKAQLSDLSEFVINNFDDTNFGQTFQNVFSNTRPKNNLNNAPIAATEHFSLETGQEEAVSIQTTHPLMDQTPSTMMLETMENEWMDFKVLFNKSYPTPDVESQRKQNFFTNRLAISIFNQNYAFGRSTFVLAINSFADLLVEEFNRILNGFRGGNRKFYDPPLQPSFYIQPMNINKPLRMDWRELGGVSPVRYQGTCASCHAFSAVGAIEGQIFRKTGSLIELSPQNLLDCPTEKNYQGFGCNGGGYVDEDFKYIWENPGIDFERAYPYEGVDGACRFNSNAIGANITGYVEIPEGDEDALETAIATLGPVSVGVDASQMTFQFYSRVFITMSYGCQKDNGDENFKYVKDNSGIDFKHAYRYEDQDFSCRFRPEGVGAIITGVVLLKNVRMILSLCFVTIQSVSYYDLVQEEWEEFKVTHKKQYENPTEEKYRMQIFMENVHTISKHNQLYGQGLVTFKMGVNKYADMLPIEFVEIMNGYNNTGVSEYNGTRTTFIAPENIAVPDSFDWREKGAVTGVKDQGSCGSCWSFSATGALEGQNFRKTGKLVELSEQNLMDCSYAYGNNGCGGGLMDNAFKYVIANKGIDTEAYYPYEAEDMACRYNSAYIGAVATGLVDIPSLSEQALLQAVATIGPISVAIDASHMSFQFYDEGIYYEPSCSPTQLDHGVLVVGYGGDSEGEYWLVKNSWGKSWGDHGYIKMSRNRNNNCGIATMASYPLMCIYRFFTMKFLLIFGLVFVGTQAISFFDLVQEQWNAYKLSHSKSYENPTEEKYRMKIFMENSHHIAKHNQLYEQGLVSYKLKLNKWADMLHHEFIHTVNGFNRTTGYKSANINEEEPITFIPRLMLNFPMKSIGGLRELSLMLKIKDNVVHVGVSVRFSYTKIRMNCMGISGMTGALEGQHFRRTGKLVSLSEQNLIDCSAKFGNNGCNGGLMDNAFRYVKSNHGIDTESSYPYEAEDDKCRYNPKNSGATDKGFVDIPSGDEEKLKAAVAVVGPVSVAIDASHESFQFYSEGVYYDPQCSSEMLDHGVLAVGYGTDDNGQDYWLVKNSWGETWGDKGYVKMARNRENHCGIATQSSYPLV